MVARGEHSAGPRGGWASELIPGSATSLVHLPVDQMQSARCACSAGSTLKDVTEAIGLVGNERTLACACLADRVLLQVMHKRMQLCSMDAVLPFEQGQHPASYFPCIRLSS